MSPDPSPMTEPASAPRQLVFAAFLIAAAVLAWYNQDALRSMTGFAAEPSAKSPSGSRAGVPVIVTPVDFARDALSLQVVGTGRAIKSVSLRAEASGKVQQLEIHPGASFKQGDILLRLDDVEQKLAVEIAEARLAEAKRASDRAESLRTSGNTALARLQEVQTTAEIARLELERAKETLKDRVLRAPFDGISGLSNIEVGAWVDTSVDIASYDDRSVILVEFDLPETLLPRVTVNMPVTATTVSAAGEAFQGSVSAIDSRIAASSRTAKVRVSIPNPGNKLLPGASFTIKLDASGQMFARIPELSLQFYRGELYVWRVKDGKAEQVAVSMQRRSAGSVLVDGGLSTGDLIVVEGSQRLEPGQPVQIIGRTGGPAA